MLNKETQNFAKNLTLLPGIKAAAMSFLQNGYSAQTIAETLGITVSTLYRWRRTYEQSGLSSFYPSTNKRGPKKTVTPEIEHEIKTLIQTNPHNLGIPFPRWTSQALIYYLNEFHEINMSARNAQRILTQLQIQN